MRDTEKLKVKTVEIIKAVRRLELTQQEACQRGNFANPSERKLMDCMNRLGYDIKIKAKLAARSIGHLTLAVMSEFIIRKAN